MKILEKKYPLGSFKKQQTPGRYFDGMLYQNIDILAKNVIKDMTYLAIISSSTLEVGTGKSVFVQQMAEAYLDAVNRYHGLNLELTMNNIVFRPKDIIDRSFEVPRYSVVICDEWEDANYWSELGVTLRKFFRKCRQLNLFIIIIIPNFFQLPMSYAISRSVFFVDVRFDGEFERGFFSFYSFKKKKYLYIKGKKTQDYDIVKPNFRGRFLDGYVVNEKEYRKSKLNDLTNQEKEEKRGPTERETKIMIVKKIHAYFTDIPRKELAKALEVHYRTLLDWLNDKPDDFEKASVSAGATNSVNLIPQEIVVR